ncbi:MAG: hypothetical protein LQ339_003559 [Xanthoria mediterranea]|nr:MAG: hypothetical protein LQ339_003559 [Xanthoria mediterranea]
MEPISSREDDGTLGRRIQNALKMKAPLRLTHGISSSASRMAKYFELDEHTNTTLTEDSFDAVDTCRRFNGYIDEAKKIVNHQDRESDIIELLMSAYLIVEKGNPDAQVEEFNSYLRELPKSVRDRFFADRQQFNALRSDI